MDPGLVSVLSLRLFPLLHLSDLHAFRGTCTALSNLINNTESGVWLTVARCVLSPVYSFEVFLRY